MANKINFSELKRKEVRRTIGEGEGAIEIYNPNPEQQKEIKQMVFDCIDKETGKPNIDGKLILVKLIPMLTNIYIDTDNDELLEEIINDPSDILREVVDEIQEIVYINTSRLRKDINTLNEIPKEYFDEIFNTLEENTKEELTEDELKIIEKAKRLKMV